MRRMVSEIERRNEWPSNALRSRAPFVFA